MSHFPILVIGDDVADLLAPYDENLLVAPYKDRVESDPEKFPISVLKDDGLDLANLPLVAKTLSARWDEEYLVDEDGLYTMSTYNPASKWDWYLVGGRWRGFFLLKPGSLPGILGRPGTMDNPPMHPGGVDVCTKDAVDFDAMGRAAAEQAVASWTRYDAIRSQHPTITPWKDVLEAAGGVGSIDAARKVYWDQPGVQALQDARLLPFTKELEDVYAPTIEEQAERARRQAPITHALVTAEGWAESGKMGMWGVTHDPRPEEDWETFWWGIVNAARDDAIFSLVDCHI